MWPEDAYFLFSQAFLFSFNPFIFFCLSDLRAQESFSLSQGKRHSPSWMSRQSVARLTQTTVLIFTPIANLESQSKDLRKPECTERTHADTRRPTQTPHRNSQTGFKPRTFLLSSESANHCAIVPFFTSLIFNFHVFIPLYPFFKV